MPRFAALLVLVPLLLAGCAGDPRSADCRALGLDTGWGTCLPPDSPPPPQPYCTRTLARAECWANPDALPGKPPQIADGPRFPAARPPAARPPAAGTPSTAAPPATSPPST